jgi:acyl transferase domain-containing protein/NAD(P)-dependent dehydrogenase (short-subunit alcohol dehydrogenase family)
MSYETRTAANAACALPPNQRPLAIIGLGCRLPGASDLDEYWDLIASGRTAYRILPPERLDQEVYYCPEVSQRPRTLTRLGGIVSPYKGIRELHGLNMSDVRQSDPAHLELFGVVEDALESAGWNRNHFKGKKTGVYLGHTRGTGRCGEIVYRTLVPQTARWLQELDEFASLDPVSQERVVNRIVRDVQNRYVGSDCVRSERLAAFSAASLIAKGFELEGPFLSLNAACASSLAALNYAGEALALNEIDIAVVGSGSFVEFDSLVLFSRAGSVSKTGSRPFDSQADGLIPSEGYVALILKSLDKALADNDPILAVIRGFGCSSDGKGKSLWAPREEGQILAVQRAYGEYLSPTRLGYIEAHATSTAVGDATEMAALTKALAEKLAGHPKIPVGSVKANIGHTLETAGLAALAKVVLAIRHQSIPPVANVRTPNPNIDWDASPLYLPRKLQAWEPKDSLPRRAGVNSFGIGGLNAHVVVEEFVPNQIHTYFEPDSESQKKINSAQSISASHHETPQNVSVIEKDRSDEDDFVAIIGVGAIAPAGHTAEDFWNLTKDGQVHIGEPPIDRVNPKNFDPSIQWPEKIVGGFVRDYQYHWRKHKVPPKQVADADPLQFMLLDAVDQALNDTGITLTAEQRKRTGVVIGSVFGGEFGSSLQMGLRLPEFSKLLSRYLKLEGVADENIESMIDRYQALLLSRLPSLNDETGSFTSSTLASRITKTFDVMGGGAAIDSGHGSGLTALQISVNALRSKDVDLMICACGQRSLGQFQYELIGRNKFLSSFDKINVSSPDSDGIIPGEGAGVVVLKRLKDAVRDGNRIYAIVQRIEQVRREKMDDALRDLDAKLAKHIVPGDLAYVELDANGASDANAEFSAIESELTHAGKYKVPVAALKEQIGETFGASALLSVIRACKVMAEGRLPGCNGASDKRLPQHLQALNESQQRWNPGNNVPASVIVHSISEDLATGVVLGNVAAVTGRSPETRNQASAASHSIWERQGNSIAEPSDSAKIFRFAADSVSEILHQLEAASDNPTQWLETAQFDSKRNRSSTQQKPNFRLNIAANNPATLKQKIAMAGHALSQASKMSNLQSQGIFFGERGSLVGAKTAFVFSGQGSQYRGMLSSYLESSAPNPRVIEDVNESIQKLAKVNLKELLADRRNEFGTNLEKTQLGILSCEIMLFDSLLRLGIQPDVALGHSFGEYGALYSAGCLNISDVLRLSVCRAQAVQNSSVIPGQLACLFCDEASAKKIIADYSIDAHIANCNSPQQTVIGIPKDRLAIAKDKLDERRVRMRILPVPFAFHTPLMEDAKHTMSFLIRNFQFKNCQRNFISTVTETSESDGSKLPDILCEQFVKPVRWSKLMSDLKDQGYRFFIEVGPNQILTGLNRNIFKTDENIICVATDDARLGAVDQLVLVEAAKEIFEHCSEIIAPANRLSTSQQEKAAQNVTAVEKVASSSSTQEVRNRQPFQSVSHDSTSVSIHNSSNSKRKTSSQLISRQKPDSSRILQRFVAYRARHGSNTFFPNLGFDYLEDDGKESIHALSRSIGVNPKVLLQLNYFLENQAILSRTEFTIPGRLHGVFDILRDAIITEKPVYHWNARRSNHGIRYALLSLSGQVGGLMGINEHRLSVSCSLPVQPASNAGNHRQKSQTIFVADCLGSCKTLDEAVAILEKQDLLDGSRWLISQPGEKTLHAIIDKNRFNGQKVNAAFTYTSSQQQSEEKGNSKSSSYSEQVAVGPLRSTLNSGFENMDSFWKEWSYQSHPNKKRAIHGSSLCAIIDSTSMMLSVQFSSHVTSETQLETIHFESLFEDISSNTASSGNEPVIKSNTISNKRSGSPSNLVLTVDDLIRGGVSVNSQPPLGDQDRICTRLVPKLIPALGREKPQWQRTFENSKILLLGNHPILSSALRSFGASIACIKSWLSSDELIAQYHQALTSLGEIDHIIVGPAFDQNAHLDSLQSLLSFDYDRDVLAVYRLAQEWFSKLGDALNPKERVFAVITRMGGHLGLTGDTSLHIGGSWSGLAKAMFLERSIMVGPDLRTFVIDVDTKTTDNELATCLLREWAQEVREAEVSYRDGTRYVLRSVQEPLPRPSRASSNLAGEGCWIITGGARGVTAEIAKALATRVNGTIHLIGSSPLPAIPKEWLSYDEVQLRNLRSEIARRAAAEKRPAAEEWNSIEKAMEIERNLSNMRAAGMKVQYHACNVASHANVTSLIEAIRKQGEPIVGVVHGAGFEKAARFSGKKLPLVNRTFEAKALGAIHLMVATAEDPIKTFVTFTSISGRYGAIGQTDYGSANEWLTKITARYATLRPQTHAVAMDWHSWDEVGMAARPETKHSPMLKTIKFMPVQEGIDHFLAEICPSKTPALRPASEVIITDWGYHKLYFPDPSIPVDAYDLPTTIDREIVTQDATDSTTANPGTLFQLVREKWSHQPIGPKPNDLTGLICVVGSNPTTQQLCNLLAAKGLAYVLWASPQTEKEKLNLKTCLGSLPVKNLFWLMGLDEGADLGGGWIQHRDRLDQIVNAKETLRCWLENELFEDRRIIVASRAPSVESEDIYGGIIGSPEGSWLKSILVENPTLSDNCEICRLVWLSNQRNALDEAISIFEEASYPGKDSEVHVSGKQRYVQQSDSKTWNAATNHLQRQGNGLWIIANLFSNPRENALHGIVSQSWLNSEIVDLSSWSLLEDKILSTPDSKDRRKAEAAQFTELLKHIDRIHTKHGDCIEGVLIVDAKVEPRGDQDLRCAKLLSQLMQCCQADSIRRVALIASHNLQISKAWLKWFAAQMGIEGVAIEFYGNKIEESLAIALDHLAEPREINLYLARETGLEKPIELPNTEEPNVASTLALQPSVIGEGADRLCELTVDPTQDPFLTQHRFRDVPLMPLVAISEIMVQSAKQLGLIESHSAIRICKLSVLNGLKFFSNQPAPLFVRFQPRDTGINASLFYSFTDSQGRVLDRERVVATATLTNVPKSNQKNHPPCLPHAPWHPVIYPDAGAIIYHGSPFRCLKRIQFFENGTLAEFIAQPDKALGGDRIGEWILPMGVIDSALYACGVLAWVRDYSGVAIPAGIESIIIHRQTVADEYYSGSFTLDNITDNEGFFSGTVYDSSGRLVFELSGYKATIVRQKNSQA